MLPASCFINIGTTLPNGIQPLEWLFLTLEELIEGVAKRLFSCCEGKRAHPSPFSPFEDPWSRLASQAGQKRKVVVLSSDSSSIHLTKGSTFPSASEKAKNRETIEKYQEFLRAEYGNAKIDQIVRTYGDETSRLTLDLNLLKEMGQPLTSKHIYIYNMGLADFDMQDLSGFLDRVSQNQILLGREQRGLESLFPEQEKRHEFLEKLRAAKGSSDKLDLDTFNQVISILEPPTEGDALYTGHKVARSIKTCYTEGSIPFHITFKPWLDQQELLQIFPDLKAATTFDAWYELLVKVAVKKNLTRVEGDYQWRVGELIPAPGGRWYRVEQCVDAGAKFFYKLVPAHPGYNAPEGLIYRSTASDPYQQGGAPSLLSDLNPNKLPGYDARKRAWKEEDAVFKPFSAPLWLVFYEKALKEPADEGCLKKAQEELILLGEWNPAEGQTSGDYLKNLAEASDEWDAQKQTLAGKRSGEFFVAGDSLAGSEAQQFIAGHLADKRRVPLGQITCFAHSAPVIKKTGKASAEQFKQFVDENSQYFPGSISIELLMEEGDVVPQKLSYQKQHKDGSAPEQRFGVHLGYGVVSNDRVCVRVRYFKALRAAVASEVRDMMPHERRYLLRSRVVEGRDYTVQQMSVQEFDDKQTVPFLFKVARSRPVHKTLSAAVDLKRKWISRRNMPLGLEGHTATTTTYLSGGSETVYKPHNSTEEALTSSLFHSVSGRA